MVTTTALELWSPVVKVFGQKPESMQYGSAAPFLGVDRAPVTLKQGKWENAGESV